MNILGDHHGGSAVLRAKAEDLGETEGRIGESEVCEGLVQKPLTEVMGGESRGLARQPQYVPFSGVEEK